MDAHCLKEKFFTVLRSSAEQAEFITFLIFIENVKLRIDNSKVLLIL